METENDGKTPLIIECYQHEAENPPPPLTANPGEDVDRTNRIRRALGGYNPYPVETSLVEFLSDLIYFCEIRNFDFDHALDEARKLPKTE